MLLLAALPSPAQSCPGQKGVGPPTQSSSPGGNRGGSHTQPWWQSRWRTQPEPGDNGQECYGLVHNYGTRQTSYRISLVNTEMNAVIYTILNAVYYYTWHVMQCDVTLGIKPILATHQNTCRNAWGLFRDKEQQRRARITHNHTCMIPICPYVMLINLRVEGGRAGHVHTNQIFTTQCSMAYPEIIFRHD